MLSLRLWNYWIVQTTGSWFKELIKFTWHFTSLINSWSASAHLGSQETPPKRCKGTFWWGFPHGGGAQGWFHRSSGWFELEGSLKIISHWALSRCHPSPEKGDHGQGATALSPSQSPGGRAILGFVKPCWVLALIIHCLLSIIHWLSIDCLLIETLSWDWGEFPTSRSRWHLNSVPSFPFFGKLILRICRPIVVFGILGFFCCLGTQGRSNLIGQFTAAMRLGQLLYCMGFMCPGG